MEEQEPGVDVSASVQRREALQQAFDQIVEQIAYHHTGDLKRCWNTLLDVMGYRKSHGRLDNWMEKRITKLPHLSPTRLAGEARYYCKMPNEMMPFLKVLARRVKTRVRIRRFRERLEADMALERGEVNREETS